MTATLCASRPVACTILFRVVDNLIGVPWRLAFALQADGTGSHFAVFPPELVRLCILGGSRPGDIILDPFLGSGTTAMVALQHGRGIIGIELKQEYAALARERIGTMNAASSTAECQSIRTGVATT